MEADGDDNCLVLVIIAGVEELASPPLTWEVVVKMGVTKAGVAAQAFSISIASNSSSPTKSGCIG